MTDSHAKQRINFLPVSDKTTDLQGARKWKQFRFKDIIDMETGDPIFELEHEMRSIQHEAWPGPKL